MTIKIHLFGITKDIIGAEQMRLSVSQKSKVEDILNQLKENYPKLKELNSLFLAVNQTYAPLDLSLQEQDEIALIPPVSGG